MSEQNLPANDEPIDAGDDKVAVPSSDHEELKLSELLILASLWMLFGFMLWFYLSAFHGAPARIMSGAILSEILGANFHQIVVEPNQNFLFQVETAIPFRFKDGTTESLGFVVNPLIFSYGLPLLFGLVMGSDVSWLRKASTLLVGYVVITFVQVWGVVFQALKMMAFNFGGSAHDIVRQAGVSDTIIALGYQMGTLILPALAPIFVWVLLNRPLVEQFVGWDVTLLGKRDRP
ncbi:MAG TPA: exosortase H-associated membrane protein [Xanthomonadales bacterium]|nr:exosortase H-associated membrane protein [Xanthomonadales bacterium]